MYKKYTSQPLSTMLDLLNCWVLLFIQDWWFMTADKVYSLFVKGGCSPDCQVMIYVASDEHTVANVCF